METNVHYQQYAALIPKIGQEKAVERARNAYRSHVLSKDFGETAEAFLARSERAQGLLQFINEHR